MSIKSLVVHPNSLLKGDVYVTGAKNAVLRHLVASLLTDEPIEITNYPSGMLDVDVQEGMLEVLGKNISKQEGKIRIEGKIDTSDLVWTYRSIRNTLLILGALLTRTGFAKVPFPGGCSLGRKYDLHVALIRCMGGEVWSEGDYLYAKSEGRLKGCEYSLDYPSTGVTENAILMGALADGVTVLKNPHLRPETMDLIELMREMGASIEVNDAKDLVINGVESLHGFISHKAIGDSIQAFSYLIAGALCGEKLSIHNFPSDQLDVPLSYAKNNGVKYVEKEDCVIVRKGNPHRINIVAEAYPGLCTDLQPIFAVWAAVAEGRSYIYDRIYEDRFAYAKEFEKMGVKYEKNEEQTLEILGTGRMINGGVTLLASDLRAGMACLLLALCADKPVKIDDFWVIERGYDNVFQTFKSLGVSFSDIEYNI